MALLNHVTREITAKVVYYGPGLCGKTSNLKYIYDNLEDDGRGQMLSLATEADRTLFFDFLPMDLGAMRGFKIRVQLYTVPGQVFYEATRKRVLKGCDGVVFVADSQRRMQEANRESLAQLSQHLEQNGLLFEEVPIVLQYNKRDLPDLLSVEELDADLNPANAPFFEAVASEGIGVEDTLKAAIKLVLKNLLDKGIIRQEEDSGILAAHPLPRTLEMPGPVDGERPPLDDTAPNALAPASAGPAASAGDADSLFEEAAPELTAASGADPFGELEEMARLEGATPAPRLEVVPAAPATPQAPFHAVEGMAPEWLFSEPGEETASLLAQSAPLDGAMGSDGEPEEELLLEPAASAVFGSLQSLPDEGRASVAEPLPKGDEGTPGPVAATPALSLAPGQVQSVTLVIDGKSYRLQLRLDRMD